MFHDKVLGEFHFEMIALRHMGCKVSLSCSFDRAKALHVATLEMDVEGEPGILRVTVRRPDLDKLYEKVVMILREAQTVISQSRLNPH